MIDQVCVKESQGLRNMDHLIRWAEQIELLIAGLIGAMVAAPFQPSVKSKTTLLTFIIGGAACAHYLTALVVDKFSIEPTSVGGVAFLLGAFGGSLIAKVMSAIQSLDLARLIKAKLDGGAE